MKISQNSVSETNGIELVDENDFEILSIGISTAGSAEIQMAKRNPKCHMITTTIDEEGIKLTDKLIKESGLQDRIELNDVTDIYTEYIQALKK